MSLVPSADPRRMPVTTPPAPRALARIFDHVRIWHLTSEVFEAAAVMLAVHEQVPDVVVGIARGGMPLAQLLGAHYGVPVLELTARHNLSDGIYAEATGIVELTENSFRDQQHPAGSKILVADDICGTGATSRAVLRWVTGNLRPSRLRMTALCRNEGASPMPDSWLWDTRDWVVFPWNEAITEPTEPLALPVAVLGKDRQ